MVPDHLHGELPVPRPDRLDVDVGLLRVRRDTADVLPSEGFGVGDASDAEIVHTGLFSVVLCLSTGVEGVSCRLIELAAGSCSVIDKCVTVKPWSEGEGWSRSCGCGFSGILVSHAIT